LPVSGIKSLAKASSRDKQEASQNRDNGLSEPVHAVYLPAKIERGVPDDVIKFIANSIADLADGENAVFLGELGNLLRRKMPDFDSRNYGYASLSALIKAIDRFSIDFRQTSDPNIKHPYVKDKLG